MNSNYVGTEFEAFIKLIPYISQLFEDEVSFAVANGNEYIYVNEHERFKLGAKVGESLVKGGAGLESYRTGKKIKKIVSKEAFGTPFISYAIPITNESNSVVGSFLVAKSLAKRNELLEMADNLNNTIWKIDNTMESFFKKVESILNLNIKVVEQTKDASDDIKKTDKILRVLQEIESQLNLLGLNASIEAARAGASGRGFGVVADEIQKLSKSSNKSTSDVSGILKDVDSSFSEIRKSVNDVCLTLEEEVQSFKNIITSMNDVKEMVVALNELSEKI